MAKITLVALVLAAFVATSFARDVAYGRSLKQARPSYTCGQAQLLQGTGCQQMLACLRKSAPALATTNNLRLFTTSCNACATATKGCATAAAKAGPVPAACRVGLSIKPVTDCVGTLLKTVPKAGH